MALMRDMTVGIVPLVDELRRRDLRPSAYLACAEQELEEPVLVLPAKPAR